MTLITLTLGAGGNNYSYSSYASVAEADEYLAADPELCADWFALRGASTTIRDTPLTTVAATPASTVSVIHVVSAARFRVGDFIVVGTEEPVEIGAIDGNEITLEAALSAIPSEDTEVWSRHILHVRSAIGFEVGDFIVVGTEDPVEIGAIDGNEIRLIDADTDRPDSLSAVPSANATVYDSQSDKVKRLVAATRRLDRLTWCGEKAGGMAQDTAWPRSGLTYPDETAIATTDIPAEVEETAILLAGDLTADLAGTAGGRQEQVRSMTAGRISESFFFQEISQLELLLPGGTLDLIKYWLKSARSIKRPTVTGRDTNRPSEFSERYERDVWTGGLSGYSSSRRR